MARDYRTGDGRVAYPSLFKAREYNGKTQYQVTLVFPKGDAGFSRLVKEVRAFVEEAVPSTSTRGKKLHPRFRWPWRKGSEKVDADGNQIAGFEATDYFVTFKRDEDYGRIPVLGPDLTPAQPAQIYGGCIGRVAFRPFLYKDYGNGPGVSLGLEGFQLTGKGTPIGAAPIDPQKVFEPVEFDDFDEDFEDEDDFDDFSEEDSYSGDYASDF